VSAIQALALSEPGAARDAEDTMPGLAVGSPPSAGQCCGLRVLNGAPDQVKVARHLVRHHLAGHPAAADAELVASELAANSVMHSASRFGDGQFIIRVTALDGRYAAVTVTDQGGPFAPHATATDGESGRGLTVVRSLACLFRIYDHDRLRTFTAIISAEPDAALPDPPGAPGQQTITARTAAAARSAERTHIDGHAD
jgi:anti-sigma regulatory factor (Ser/Thr protein kinase)